MVSDLDAVLVSLGVTMTARHVGLVTDAGDKWPHDTWTCTIAYQGRTHTTPFKQGIGHRKMRPMVKREGERFWNELTRTYARNATEAAHLNWSDPTPPTAADVLYCLASDARSAESTFEEWCGEMGADTDSRKAFATYQECMATRDAMVRLLGRATLDEISNAEH